MRITFFAALIASLALLVSATVWEGVGIAASRDDLPGDYGVATNSFPKNTVVELTNLENGRIVRAMVVSGLDASGFLAALSPKAAEALDLRGNYNCRIRMTRPSDEFVISNIRLGPIAAMAPLEPEPETGLAANASAGTEPFLELSSTEQSSTEQSPVEQSSAELSLTGQIAEEALNGGKPPNQPDEMTNNEATLAENNLQNQTVEAGYEMPDNSLLGKENEASGNNVEAVAGAKMQDQISGDANGEADDSITVAAPESPAQRVAEALPVETDVKSAPANPSETGNASGTLSMVPSVERIPQAPDRAIIAQEGLLSPSRPQTAAAGKIPETEYVPAANFSPFQVPLISQLEKGKWYVQLATYTRHEYVEDEISRIGTAYPLAIQNIGSDASPMFRVLLGPMNQGESGAVLRRFKSIGYADAFLRNN
ncbi:MAG: hypothetical protein LBG95_07175 [Treponema sp.]|jgi:hypothetical protein|nr:hypothetical protein [Treponema sp.]